MRRCYNGESASLSASSLSGAFLTRKIVGVIDADADVVDDDDDDDDDDKDEERGHTYNHENRTLVIINLRSCASVQWNE